ncbi:MAG: hypothetical protein KDB90_01245 [Planctomycetes bacterium]|nr:hypothetical protein [Planctomycetota bacterium]
MSVPSEIRKLLAGREPKAYASLSCSFHGPIGETHFVVADGQLFVFERESLIGDFKRVTLDPEFPPKLEKGTFSDTLHVALADGEAYELTVSSFDRDALEQVLLENATAAPAEIVVGVEATASEVLKNAPAEAGADPVGEPESADTPAQDELIDLRKKAEEFDSKPQPQPSEPKHALTAVDQAKDNEAEEDKRADAEVAVYYGSDSGCFGCALLLVVFSAAVVGFWYLHIEAARTIGLIGPTEEDADSFSFIATKIIALIAGAYVGGRAAQLVNKVLNGLGLTGRVMFSQNVIQVFGRLGKWHLMITTPVEFQMTLEAYSEVEAATDSQGKPAKRAINYYLRIGQHGKSALLKTSNYSAVPYREIAEVPVKQAIAEPTSDQLITFEYKTFKKLLRKLPRVR